jgi:hypothetical protein
VTLKDCVPATSGALGGRTPLPSDEVMVTLSIALATKF